MSPSIQFDAGSELLHVLLMDALTRVNGGEGENGDGDGAAGGGDNASAAFTSKVTLPLIGEFDKPASVTTNSNLPSEVVVELA